jgi:hypothetical protein
MNWVAWTFAGWVLLSVPLGLFLARAIGWANPAVSGEIEDWVRIRSRLVSMVPVGRHPVGTEPIGTGRRLDDTAGVARRVA